MTSLRTERLLLRPARIADAVDLHAVFGDAAAMRYWSSLPHPDVATTAAWVESMIAIPVGAGEDFILEFEGRAVGKAGSHRFPDYGFILRRDLWGRGLAREAMEAVLPRAFAYHGLDCATADVDPRNAASLGLLRRLGFVETRRAERTWRIGDEWCDSVYLALSAARWTARIRALGTSGPAT